MNRTDVVLLCGPVTPFGQDGSIDYDALRQHLRRLIREGSGFYLCAGGASQGPVLTLQEMRRIYEIAVEEGKGKVPLHASPPEAPSAARMHELARVAIDAGVDVVRIYQLEGGHGMVPTLPEQTAYWHDLLNEIDHPVSISINSMSRFRAPVQLLTQLCQRYSQIVSLDLTGQPIAYFMEVRDALPSSIRIYTDIENFVQMLTLGASGALVADSNVIPRICQSIVDHYLAGDMENLGAANRTLHRFRLIVSEWGGTARWVNMALKVLGLPGGTGFLRPPYRMPSEEDQRRLAAAFDRLKIRELEGLEQSSAADRSLSAPR